MNRYAWKWNTISGDSMTIRHRSLMVYEEATGEILRVCTCARPKEDYGLAPGEAVLARGAQVDDVTHHVVDGSICERTP